MRKRLFLEIIKKLNNLERQEKRIAEAQETADVIKDWEKEKGPLQ
jgi:hypothetical protein